MSRPVRGFLGGWQRFWFEPEPTSTLALIRIAFGLLVLVWAISLAGDLTDFFAEDGILAEQPSRTIFTLSEAGVWGVLDVFPGDAAVIGLYVALLVGAVALIVGFWARLAALVVFVGVLSFERRNPFVFNSGDYLVRNLSFLVLLAPVGVSLSIDRWRSERARFWEFPARAPWALRLIQLQVSFIYLSSVWAKVQGATWNDGTAVGYALRISDHARFSAAPLSDSLLVTNFVTYGTLATELALGTLIWNRKARPYVIAAGIGMHLFIDLTLLVGFFSYAMFVCYLSFLTPEHATRLIEWVRDRGFRRRRTREPEPQVATGVAASET